MSPFNYQNGILHAENVSLHNIAEKFGTPSYVYSRSLLENNWREYRNGFKKIEIDICYSVKANSNLAVLAVMANLGSGFDIVSGGELERVIQAGGRADKTIFSGVGKSVDEIYAAMGAGVKSINIESESELLRVHKIAQYLNVTAPVSMRVNPDVDADTHPHIATGLREAKFGIPFDEARNLYEFVQGKEHLRVHGIAMHIGSQMTSLEPIVAALHRVIDFIEQLAENEIEIQHLDLGGGLGVHYKDEDPPAISEYCAAIESILEQRNCNLALTIEPGRSITAQAGVLLSRIEYIKHSESKNFAIVDAAMNDLIRPVLYDAWMEIVPVIDEKGIDELYDVVGPVCETGDFLGKDRNLPAKQGELLAVMGAGAYGAVMSSNYNTRPKPAEVLVSGDDYDLVRQRETIHRILELESIPEFLRS